MLEKWLWDNAPLKIHSSIHDLESMPNIKFILADNSVHEIQAETGTTVMQLARRSGFAGILAECGGVCSCATCHVHIDKEWMPKLAKMEDLESDMLEFAEDVGDTSRLSCQISITDDLDGLVVHVPESQY